MKAYASLEQSRKLAEILPIESADMCWQRIYDENHLMTDYRIELLPYRLYSGIAVPCWSFAALLDVIPYKLQIVLAINDFKGDRKEKYVIGSVEHDKYDCYADNPVDACAELIIKLHELKML